MVIIGQSGNAVIDTMKIDKLTTNKEGGIYATCANTRETLAKYDNLNMAKFVLKMYAENLVYNSDLFEFPKASDISEMMSIHRNNVTKGVKSNSHGGS